MFTLVTKGLGSTFLSYLVGFKMSVILTLLELR